MLGRFFSPDNYVQMPDFSQSFNRYSYCLNNPLKYTDPSGELFGIDDAAFAFAFFGMANSMMQAAYNGGNIWKAGAISLLSSAASFGIGQAFGNVGGFGKELLRAGAHGLASGVFNALDGGSFGSGFISGAAASGIGSFAQGVNMNPGLMVLSTSSMGGFAAWVTGGEFVAGALQGLQIGMFNHVMHGDGNRHYTPNGNYYTIDDDGVGEVYVIGRNSISKARNFPTDALFVATAINTAGTIASQDVRIGTNGKLYFRNANGNIFHGNKYVKTNAIKSAIPAKYTKVTSIYLNVLSQTPDVMYSYNTYGAQSREFQRSVAVACGSVVGAQVGESIGKWGGGALIGVTTTYVSLGTLTGPAFVGGEIIGSIAGSYLGSKWGGLFAGALFDCGF